MIHRANCIGCGCDDFHACYDADTESGCFWLRVDRAIGLGVCSCCAEFVEQWDRADFTSHAEPVEPPAPPSVQSAPRYAPAIRSCCDADPELLDAVRKFEASLGLPAVGMVMHVTRTPKPCAHDWGDGNPESCLKCGLSFIRYTFMECP